MSASCLVGLRDVRPVEDIDPSLVASHPGPGSGKQAARERLEVRLVMWEDRREAQQADGIDSIPSAYSITLPSAPSPTRTPSLRLVLKATGARGV